MKLTRSVTTLADLRAFLAACDVMDVPDTAVVYGKTRLGMQAQGPPIKELTVDADEPRNADR